MKILLFQLCIFLLASKADAQIFKKLGDKVKRDSEWRIRNKADQQVNKGLDSLIAIPKKASDKKKAEKDNTQQSTTKSQDNNNVAINKNVSGRSNNEFSVEKDTKGNLSFSGKANKHIGNKTDKIEHDLNFFITAKKEQ